LREGLEAVSELKNEGRIGAVGFGFYPVELWRRVLGGFDFDVALIHNHYCLHDTRLLELLPLAKDKGTGVVNGSPFASGLLTDRGAPDWHPAPTEARRTFRAAAEFCRNAGSSLSRLAIQFASQNTAIPTTLFSSADPQTVFDNVRWSEQACDEGLLQEVQRILAPVRDRDWNYV
jgi:aryl-alcohol dehydrogenase-like predicted oxidoreductase